MKKAFSKTIQDQLDSAGISSKQIEFQLADFKNGFPFAELEKAATPGDGILQLDQREAQDLQQLFKIIGSELKIYRFVPASGAASRMFKSLFEFLDDGNLNSDTQEFLKRIKEFAFADDIPEELMTSDDKKLIDYILGSGMNYASLPKALIKFHKYEDQGKSALAEHFYEASKIAGDIQENVNIHFTVSPEHNEIFQKTASELAHSYGNRFEENFILEYSEQSPATQTLAVDENNDPIVLENGELLLRPGGHGALIHNLVSLYSDIIFIKNIDNVCHESKAQNSIFWKEVLAGKLIDIRQQVFEHIDEILNDAPVTKARAFLKLNFGLELPEDREQILSALNRPIRICGMVKNEGEPGGGPFWVKNKGLQIVEKAQINTDDPTQKEILENSTHFNPVDLVCSTKNFKGEKFKLLEFVDHSAGFISEKSFQGKKIKAMELPGLWNGAMSNWLSIFVEVPVETFNPVKKVNDLLKPAHQA
jgi:hypothetical protein